MKKIHKIKVDKYCYSCTRCGKAAEDGDGFVGQLCHAIKCPVCKGNGTIAEPVNKKDLVQTRRRMCRALKEAGFSIRQIQKYIGYGSTRSVILALKSHA